jgi:1-acyl-sn-glycerol-3-phosphate acyltransferase
LAFDAESSALSPFDLFEGEAGWCAAVMSGTVHVMNRLCLFVCGYYWIRVTGSDNLHEARRAQALMVINHSAYFDMPVLFHVVTCSAVAMSAVQNVRHPPLCMVGCGGVKQS